MEGIERGLLKGTISIPVEGELPLDAQLLKRFMLILLSSVFPRLSSD